MVIWPVRVPVPVGANVTVRLQLPPGCTVAFMQLPAVTLKSPALMAGETADVRGRLPVFVTVTVSVALPPTGTGVAKVTGLGGLKVAVVKPVLAVHNGACQMPRP
jgi:hypothetical protein